MITQKRTYREIEARRTANREQRALNTVFARCTECGCSYDPKEGFNGTCSPACRMNLSFNMNRDSGESVATFGYRW